MEIDAKNFDKILDLMALYQCYGNLCTDCTHIAEKEGFDCCKEDCYNRICDVILGAK